MSTLEERVARTLCERGGRNPDERTARGPYWTWFRDDAKAVLKVIKLHLFEAESGQRQLRLSDLGDL